MNILITGAGGLIGTSLASYLKARNHRVSVLTRSKANPSEGHFGWNPESGEFDIRALRDTEVVIHLAGENIGAKRWTLEQKRKITDSRIKSTALLVDAISRMDKRPRLLLSASAIGYYGNRGEEPLTESSKPGDGFLAELCRDWEAEALQASKLGLRVVCIRTGMVLSRTGGTLERMLPMFKLGLGGTLGSGSQYWSWIVIDDLVRAIEFIFENEQLSGPVNLVAPNPLSNAEFTKTLAKAIHRPAIFPAPAPVLRLALGEMADSLVLTSQNVIPKKLMDAGFAFKYPTLSEALDTILG